MDYSSQVAVLWRWRIIFDFFVHLHSTRTQKRCDFIRKLTVILRFFLHLVRIFRAYSMFSRSTRKRDQGNLWWDQMSKSSPRIMSCHIRHFRFFNVKKVRIIGWYLQIDFNQIQQQICFQKYFFSYSNIINFIISSALEKELKCEFDCQRAFWNFLFFPFHVSYFSPLNGNSQSSFTFLLSIIIRTKHSTNSIRMLTNKTHRTWNTISGNSIPSFSRYQDLKYLKLYEFDPTPFIGSIPPRVQHKDIGASVWEYPSNIPTM